MYVIKMLSGYKPDTRLMKQGLMVALVHLLSLYGTLVSKVQNNDNKVSVDPKEVLSPCKPEFGPVWRLQDQQ